MHNRVVSFNVTKRLVLLAATVLGHAGAAVGPAPADASSVLIISTEQETLQPFVEALEADGHTVAVASPFDHAPDTYVSLLGRWKLKLDPHDEGIEGNFHGVDHATDDWWDFPVPGSTGQGIAWLRQNFTIEGAQQPMEGSPSKGKADKPEPEPEPELLPIPDKDDPERRFRAMAVSRSFQPPKEATHGANT